MVGHPGRDRMIELLSRYYYWLRLRHTLARYVENCHTCARTKPSRQRPADLLHPLSIAKYLWSQISLKIITGLPTLEGKNAILTVIYQLSKIRHYIPYLDEDNRISAEATAMLIIREVFRLYDLPKIMISNRGP